MLQFDASAQVVNLRQPRLQRAQRRLLQEMLLRSERSFQLWLSPELMVFSSFARVVLPQLLLVAIVHVFFLRQIVLLVPDVFSWMGAGAAAVVTESGSSGRLTCTLGIGPIRTGSRSLRTFRGLPSVTGVGFHGSQTMAFRRLVSQRRFSTLLFNARLRAMPFGVHGLCCHVRVKSLRAMLIRAC